MKYTLLLIMSLLLYGCGSRNKPSTETERIAEQTEPITLFQDAAEIEEIGATVYSPISPADTVWVNALNRIPLPDEIQPYGLINVYFKYNQIVNGYEVTARWFPFDSESETGLLVMNFRNTRNGQSFQYVETEKYSNRETEQIAFADGFKGHRNGDVHHFDYVSPDSPDSYKEYNNNSPVGYYSSFQFTDVDFDGEKELLINGWEQGQGGNSYAVYKVKGNTLIRMDYPPFDSIDNNTLFDRAAKQITIRIWDGADIATFSIYRAINNRMTLTDTIVF